MAKSKRNRAARTTDIGSVSHASPKNANFKLNANQDSCPETMKQLWGVFPPQTKEFILDFNLFLPHPDGFVQIEIWDLIRFWSLPQHIKSTRGNIGNDTIAAFFHLALIYLKLHKVKEARALVLNGSFIHQCVNSSIEYVTTLSKSDDADIDKHLPCFARGVASIHSAELMESYISVNFPAVFNGRDRLSTFQIKSSIDQISHEWHDTSTSSALKNGHRRTLPNNGKQISLILLDNANEEDRHSLDIGSSTTLKVLFNEYAEIRGSSLRTLRFSYAGKYLFLSSVGHKTPEELGMKNQDLIMVHDTSKLQQPSDNNRCSQRASASKQTNAKKRSTKNKVKGKSESINKTQQQEAQVKTLEEYKIDHSRQLSKIYDEARARFKQIRHRLNNLTLEREPKSKSNYANIHKSVPLFPSNVTNHLDEGIGGKAGKSHYMIHVGEVQNLYKSNKVSSKRYPSALSTLDLHGYTRQDALMKLDESLKVWEDAAMQGSYPFVQPAMIICGCGNQILSETVYEWIRSNDKVSNAPRVQSTRR